MAGENGGAAFHPDLYRVQLPDFDPADALGIQPRPQFEAQHQTCVPEARPGHPLELCGLYGYLLRLYPAVVLLRHCRLGARIHQRIGPQRVRR